YRVGYFWYFAGARRGEKKFGRGMRPTGTSMRTGRSSWIASRTSLPTSVGSLARIPVAPNDSANFTKSVLTRFAFDVPHNASSRSRATLPNALSLKTTHTTLILSFTAVESSWQLYMKPPSPHAATTALSGRATLVPSANG